MTRTLPDEYLDRQDSMPPPITWVHVNRDQWARILARMRFNVTRLWYMDCHHYIGSREEQLDNLNEALDEFTKALWASPPGQVVEAAISALARLLIWLSSFYIGRR